MVIDQVDGIELVEVPFTAMTDGQIDVLQAIIEYWYKPQTEQRNIDKGLYLNDHVDLAKLRKINYRGSSIGRVFYLQRDDQVLAYLLSFDTLELVDYPVDFLRLVAPFVEHDVSFLRSVLYMGEITFIYHLCAAPDHANKYGSILLKRALDYLDTEKNVHLVVSTLDSGQHGIIKVLDKVRPNLVFLNHDYSDLGTGHIRLRVAELFNRARFLRRINDDFLPGSYDFIIPMQLNIATESFNRMLEQTKVEAKILWTSFFHNVLDLRQLNGMNRLYQGFYEPLRLESRMKMTAEIRKGRQFQVDTLREITDYLRKKDEATDQSEVASLIPSMEKGEEGGFEFFFINDKPEHHDFTQFFNALVYQLDDPAAADQWMCAGHLMGEEEDMLEPDKQSFVKTLALQVKLEKVKPNERYGQKQQRERTHQRWKQWCEDLLISQQQEEELLRLQRESRRTGGKMNPELEKIVDEIMDRKMWVPSMKRRWRSWFRMHRSLYEADLKLQPAAKKEDLWWCHGVVPISFTRGITGVMFTFTCKKPKDASAEERSLLISSLADTIANSLSRNMLNIVNKLYLSNFKTALSRFKTAALSARNLSHNVGSHVLSFLSQPTELADIIWQEDPEHQTPPRPAFLEQFRGVKDLAHFFDFTKVRMSLLADMATNEPVASTPEWLNANVLDTFREQVILQRYVKGNSGRKVEILFWNEDADEGYERFTDVAVQIPNGALGLSAFLMIIVNYLRNSIKYAPYKNERKIRMTLKVKSVGKSRKVNSKETIKTHRLLRLVLHDHVARDYEEAKQAAEHINSAFIRRSGTEGDEFNLAQEGLGFAEMVAAARYLRKRPFGNSWVNTTYQDHNFLEAIVVKDSRQKDKAYLGIRFYLKRPRSLLIIDEAENWEAIPEQIELLNSRGIKLRFRDQLLEWDMESFSHELAVVLLDSLPDYLQSISAFTPRMLYPKDKAHYRKLFQQSDTDEMADEIWRTWLESLRKRSASAASSDFQQVDAKTDLIESTLIFDDHGKWALERHPEPQQRGRLHFYEFYRSATPTGLLFNHLKTPHSSIDRSALGNELQQERRLHYLLQEAARTQVVIVDERIQQMLKKHEFGKEIGFRQADSFAYLAGMGVMVPDPKIEENPDFFDPSLFADEQDRLISYLEQFQGDQAVDFILIHIGLIETVLRNSRDRLIESWIERHLPDNGRTEYIIISGRGKPFNLPKRFRYLPYNNISLAVLKDCPSKYHICQSLYNARTRN